MLTQPQIEKLKAYPQMGWITALTSVAIRGLRAEGCLQLSLLDEKNLVEIQSSEYPGERLMVCYNPLLAEERKRKREDLLQATEKALTRIVKQVTLRTHDRGWKVELVAAGGGDRAGSEVGWDLCDSHQRSGGAFIGSRCGAWL